MIGTDGAMAARGKAAALVATIGLAVGLAACHPARLGEGRDRPLSVAARLDCPDTQDGLTRTAQAADGRSCTYSGDDGETVTLGYLALDGRSAQDALKPVEAGFRTDLPAAGHGADWSAGGGKADADDGDDAKDADDADDAHDGSGAKAAAPAPPSPPDPPSPPERRGRDHVAINLPGLHIDADDGGAAIRAFGQNIVADDRGAKVNGDFNGMKTQIDAGDAGAEIRFGFFGKRAVDMTYILASDAAGAHGAHAAAYVAKGPATGPLVLATAVSTAGAKHFDRSDFDDVRALVDRNVRRAGR